MNEDAKSSLQKKSSDSTHHTHSHNHDDQSVCCKSVPNPSVCQTLDDMEFERGIWQAALDDDVQRIIHIIKNQNVSPNLTDTYGYTALHYAARNGNMKATKCLIQLGAELNCQTRNNGATPVHRAIIGNKPQMVEYLLDCGASPTIKDNDGNSCLDRAIIEGNELIINIVRKHSSI